ncbi:hypothetical protein SARC_05799 [Sphaeroforma arctica JP610]|uniref:Uncharacterized protein n=1 Tax=Sphaeroforma arctica JP610 TaxID=667725 RepID=A0A0L0FZ46_9EUKA|nr:hypothetical protein SARC_05799 [Sphaeroforma arctica JP610]KNC81909.1 hypothetical protein SARC_05799 [Sphaeroforma arctica JP610]|eukprot:XP_014155811.1 hypothetical protein SARC_05799 [Sphaeroforma arctica JP610]
MCFDCGEIDHCYVCKTLICSECAGDSCDECGSRICENENCENTLVYCDNCYVVYCASCKIGNIFSCTQCDKTLCKTCEDPDMFGCLSCGAHKCRECSDCINCAGCGDVVCELCADNGVKCDECREHQCGECAFRLLYCQGCHAEVCIACDINEACDKELYADTSVDEETEACIIGKWDSETDDSVVPGILIDVEGKTPTMGMDVEGGQNREVELTLKYDTVTPWPRQHIIFEFTVIDVVGIEYDRGTIDTYNT